MRVMSYMVAWVALLGLVILSLCIGRYSLEIDTVLALLLDAVGLSDGSASYNFAEYNLFWSVRFPRTMAAVLVGAGLASAGASFQGVFRNPLVSPYILGVAAGAGFGAALGILFSVDTWWIQTGAVVFGLLAVVITYGMSHAYRGAQTLPLVLSGITVGAFFTALISLIKFVADPYEKLPAIVFWLMGSLASVGPIGLYSVGCVLVLAMVALTLMSRRINVLSMGDREATSFGVNVKKERAMIIFLCTIITAMATCLGGIIGWVGLIIPHVARLLVGPDNRKVVALSTVLGGIYLLAVDMLARNISSVEIPLGIMTATIGAPVFAYLLLTRKVRW